MNRKDNGTVLCHYGDLMEVAAAAHISAEEIGNIMIAWWQWAATDRVFALADLRLEAVCAMLRQQTLRDRARSAQCSIYGKLGGRPVGGASGKRMYS